MFRSINSHTIMSPLSQFSKLRRNHLHKPLSGETEIHTHTFRSHLVVAFQPLRVALMQISSINTEAANFALVYF